MKITSNALYRKYSQYWWFKFVKVAGAQPPRAGGVAQRGAEREGRNAITHCSSIIYRSSLSHSWRVPKSARRATEACEIGGQRGAEGRVVIDKLTLTD